MPHFKNLSLQLSLSENCWNQSRFDAVAVRGTPIFFEHQWNGSFQFHHVRRAHKWGNLINYFTIVACRISSGLRWLRTRLVMLLIPVTDRCQAVGWPAAAIVRSRTCACTICIVCAWPCWLVCRFYLSWNSGCHDVLSDPNEILTITKVWLSRSTEWPVLSDNCYNGKKILYSGVLGR